MKNITIMSLWKVICLWKLLSVIFRTFLSRARHVLSQRRSTKTLDTFSFRSIVTENFVDKCQEVETSSKRHFGHCQPGGFLLRKSFLKWGGHPDRKLESHIFTTESSYKLAWVVNLSNARLSFISGVKIKIPGKIQCNARSSTSHFANSVVLNLIQTAIKHSRTR